MCGIVGVASQAQPADGEMLAAMRDTLRHRGPDDAGLWLSPDGRVGLAQRRLAVIDLSPGGHQPMSDSSGQLWLTFNGEIYNYQEVRRDLEARGHRFRTASDTEVILEAYRAWGRDCLARLNGMFAFCLYDNTARQLFLARDRAGEKPLFYRHAAGTLAFASELKALMADPGFPRGLDFESLEYYLTYGYVPGEKCILKDTRKLLPGHFMTYDIDGDHLQIRRYWQLPDPCALATAPHNELMEELETLLTDSVRLRLIADVPTGIMLSGGIDSSLVTALAARVSPGRVKTFTISFPGHGTYDEAPQARLVASHFGTEHTELEAEPATVDLLPKLASQFDEPMGDSSLLPTYLVSGLIRQHATVALGGDGGDELFGGYTHYGWILQQERARRLIPPLFRAWMGLVATRVLPVGLRGRNYLIALTAELPRRIVLINAYFDPLTRHRLLSPAWSNGTRPRTSPEAYKAELCSRGKTPLQKVTVADFMTSLVDDILVKVDRASMLTSLEVRTPWLDHRIVEFAFGRVPDTARATEAEQKILPRCLARRLLPRELDLSRKQGFSLPLSSWFTGDWGKYIESVLGEADPQLFDQRVIRSLIAGQRRGYSNTSRLFALTMFELWRRHYRVAVTE